MYNRKEAPSFWLRIITALSLSAAAMLGLDSKPPQWASANSGADSHTYKLYLPALAKEYLHLPDQTYLVTNAIPNQLVIPGEPFFTQSIIIRGDTTNRIYVLAEDLVFDDLHPSQFHVTNTLILTINDDEPITITFGAEPQPPFQIGPLNPGDQVTVELLNVTNNSGNSAKIFLEGLTFLNP